MNTGLLIALIVGALIFLLVVVGVSVVLINRSSSIGSTGMTGMTGMRGMTGSHGITGLQCWNISISETYSGITDVFRLRAYNNNILFNVSTTDPTAVSFRIYYSTSPLQNGVYPSTYLQVPIQNNVNAYRLSGLSDNIIYYLNATKLTYTGTQSYLTGNFFQTAITTNDTSDTSMCTSFFNTLNVFSG